MIFMEIIQITTLVFALYNIYLASMALNWMGSLKLEKNTKDEFLLRFIDKLKIDIPMAFRVSIVLSFSYISIGFLITSGEMTTIPSHPSDYVIRVYNLITQLFLVRCAQVALFAEQCHKKRLSIPFTRFRFTLPIYQNQNKEYF